MEDRNLSGCTLGDFVLGKRIGEGGFGSVYRCEQRPAGREVVVKVLHPRVQLDDAARRRFLREARLASWLDHPYAAHIYAFGVEKDGLPWIAMELVEGVSFKEWLDKHGPMPLEEFVPFFERLVQVVQAAHDRGIVHRDLKPANVMVIEDAGRLLPKLLDLGIATLHHNTALPMPQISRDALAADLATARMQAGDTGPGTLGTTGPAPSITITFDEFKAPCTIPRSCAACTACAMLSKNGTNCSSGIGPCIDNQCWRMMP